jgi:RNA polymerase sigma factor (sigma-70 family)
MFAMTSRPDCCAGVRSTGEGTDVEAAPWQQWRNLTGLDRLAACLVAAQAGDRPALRAMVAELTPLIWHIARSYRLNRIDAEDVTQTVWLAFRGDLNQIKEPKAIIGWLTTTATREAQRVRRAVTATSTLADELAERITSAEPAPETEALRAEQQRHLWRLFANLSPQCQQLLRLTVLNGRASHRAVTEKTGMPHDSGPNRRRCLDALRAQLTETDGGETCR